MGNELTSPEGALRGRLDPALPPVEGATQAPIMIAFAGLSHLGIVSSIAAAARGFDVVGYDADQALCRQLKEGLFSIGEPDLAALLSRHRARIDFSADLSRLSACDLIYFSQDVPTDANNESELSRLTQWIQTAAPYAKPGAVLVVLSQVPPGFTRRLSRSLRPILDQRKISLYYQVETLIFGRAVERATKPERFMIGCPAPEKALPKAYADFLSAFGCPILPMRYESAELAKISINAFLAASVSTTNTLAEICEKMGADWGEIVPALRLDQRIGPHAYLTPGLGLAGGNIERDLVTIRNLAADFGTDSCVTEAFLSHSRHRRHWVLKSLQKKVLSSETDPVIAIWGLAYKPDTQSTKNSPTLALLRDLESVPVRLYDPEARLEEGYPNVIRCASAIEACQGANALVIMTAWNEFSSLAPSVVKEVLTRPVVIDPAQAWRQKDLSGFSYSTLGADSLDPTLS